ncbi:MAG: helix-turn-helix domain-containing protein [Proteobacteria bacterium]|nr:helix-turn-helix domain-containing protein [Pseudomonadota bacterium]MDA1254774.1 helix-turn-helix domain-containing protein [Pseudomonadota bacterium]
MNKLEMGKRIAKKREAKGLDQTELAHLLEITPQAVQQWESGQTSPRGKNLEALTNILGCTKAYLFGEEDELKPINRARYVPLIDWVAAGNWNDRHLELLDKYPKILCMFNVGPNGYALEVKGESMKDEYKPKDIIFVNPDLKPEIGDDVIAWCSNGSTFKRLIENDNGSFLLKALNTEWVPRYMPLDETCYLTGTVVGSISSKTNQDLSQLLLM